jgi:hypothetical protein
MASDLLLQLTGPAVGNQVEPTKAAAASSDGGGGGTGVYKNLGKYRSCQAEIRIGGAFDRTDGNESLAVEIWEATDAAGTGAARIASSAPIIASQAANLGSTGTVTLGSQPSVMSFNTGAGGFVKVVSNVSGTTPSIAGISVVLHPTSAGYLRPGT